MENTILQTQLRQLSKSLRDVYRDEGIDIHDQELAQLKQENQDLLELLKVSKLSDPQIPVTERSSPVLKIARNGVIEEFFSE
jgi:cell shape-determining protein MreC